MAKANSADNQEAISDKALKANKTKLIKKFNLAGFFTPFNTALVAFTLLLLFNFFYALILGNNLGTLPSATMDINWMRSASEQPFMPDFKQQVQTDKTEQTPLPRITASGSSKIIHLPDSMAEAKEVGFASDGSLSRAPNHSVLADTKYGRLPKIGPMGEKASEVYARPSTKPDGRPRIAIMITGLGINHNSTKRAINSLPGEITFGFLPYGEGLQDWINQARERGHEAILQTPMEPFDFPDNDPGPSTLLADADKALNMNHLRWTMSRLTGYIGITNFMGSKFTSKEKAVTPVLNEIKKRGLYYVENGTLHRSKVAKIAEDINLDYQKVDVIIDQEQSIEYIEDQLEKIEKIALNKGIAFAVGSSLPATMDHVREWSKGLKAKGYELVPVSAKFKHDKYSN